MAGSICSATGDEVSPFPFLGVLGFGFGPGRNLFPTGGNVCLFRGVSGSSVGYEFQGLPASALKFCCSPSKRAGNRPPCI